MEVCEFIVWDKKAKKFDKMNNNTWLEFCNYTDTVLVNSGAVGYERIATSDIDVFQYIGKTDDTPEKNKIYAEATVVEFDYRDSVYSFTEKGYFFYDCEKLVYKIKTKRGAFNFVEHSIKNLKVVGTLQENPELMEK